MKEKQAVNNPELFKDRSVFEKFNIKHYNICPACCGIDFEDMVSKEINRLCTHHIHEHTKFLIEKYKEIQDEYFFGNGSW